MSMSVSIRKHVGVNMHFFKLKFDLKKTNLKHESN